jgi:hypothetical protein
MGAGTAETAGTEQPISVHVSTKTESLGTDSDGSEAREHDPFAQTLHCPGVIETPKSETVPITAGVSV